MFLVYSDQNDQKLILNITEPSTRFTRWRHGLAEFDFELRYSKRKDNHHADALSGLLTASPTVHDSEDDIPYFLLEIEEDDLYIDTLDLNAMMYFIDNDLAEGYQLPAVAERQNTLALKQ